MAPSVVSNHNYPGYEALGDVFNISAAVSIPATSRIVATSGQIGNETPDSVTPYSPSHEVQFEIAMQNIEKSLAAASPHISDVRELWEGVYNVTSYHVGVMSSDEQQQIGAIARKYFGKNKPAWAAINVLALFPPGCLVEIQVQAAYAT
jgi:enamine deaminase RidA (YjgF/YER057c/UK114 family)